ncbi:MAG: DUF2993 domain-containing protein [Rhodoglobus sp.]
MAEPLEPVVPPVVEPVETSTEVLPAAPGTTPPAQPRTRRRWMGWLIALVVLVVLLVVGFFAADAYAKDYAKGYVRDQIIQVLKLDPTTKVDVDLGGGSVILQALRGSIDEVTVDVAELSFGDITGSAVISAAGVPLDGAEPVDKLDIVATVTEANVRKLASFMSGIELKTIELGDGVISAATEFTVLGLFVIPVSVDLVPSAVDGGISFDPKTITLAGEDISVADLRASPEFAGIAGQFLQSQDFCVASSLPKALTITDVDVVGSNLVIAINGDGTALAGAGLSELGICKAK